MDTPRRSRRARSHLATLLAAVLVAGLLAAAPAAADTAEETPPPTDYIAQADELSQPDHPETATEVAWVEAHDGVELYLEITRPDPEAHGDGPWPVILEASPYHGTIATRIGDRIFPDPVDEGTGEPLGLTGYFAPRGYAVVMMDLRGTGRSQGCLDHLGPNDAADLTTVIEWLADAEWSTGKVGMTGHSYVGSTPSVAAAQRPRGLETIVPSAGLASMYDHQFQKGVPWLLQWVGPMFAYAALSTDRHLPPQAPSAFGETGDNFGNDHEDTGCGWTTSSLTGGSGQVTGQYELWHAQRDHRAGAADADIPIFMIHGVHDNAARIPAAEWFFDGRYLRSDDKVWIGQWDHGSTNGRCGDEDHQRVLHPTCRFEQFQYAVHAWFDHHLKGMDVDTGPAVEAFVNGHDPMSLSAVRDPETWGTKVVTDTAWRRPAVRTALWPDARDGSLSFDRPDGAGSASMSMAQAVFLRTAATLEFTSEPLAEDTVFLGLPELKLNASLSNSQVAHIVVGVYRQVPGGEREPISFCAIQPQLRHGVETLAPVVPAQEMALPLSCFTMASWVPAGQQLVMEVASGSPHHATYGAEAQLTIHTGPNRSRALLPVVPDAELHDDVPLRAP